MCQDLSGRQSVLVVIIRTTSTEWNSTAYQHNTTQKLLRVEPGQYRMPSSQTPSGIRTSDSQTPFTRYILPVEVDVYKRMCGVVLKLLYEILECYLSTAATKNCRGFALKYPWTILVRKRHFFRRFQTRRFKYWKWTDRQLTWINYNNLKTLSTKSERQKEKLNNWSSQRLLNYTSWNQTG